MFFLSCLILIVAVLLQPGKTDAGALFTSNISSAAMNPRGTQSVLSKLTIVAATVFMLSALLLAMPAIKGNVSVLDTEGEEVPSTSTPAAEDGKPSEKKKDDAAETAKPADGKKQSPEKEKKGAGDTDKKPAADAEKAEGKKKEVK